MGFSFKTRGNSTPQGKPRVFFCCHENDFDRYFEKISDENLGLQNCAICYLDDYKARLTDVDKFDLLSMNLFVVPVTMNLLEEDNSVSKEIIPLATKNNIPVLPIVRSQE